MAVYIVLFGFIVIMGLVNQKYENKYNNVYSIICIVLICIVQGLRDVTIGEDVAEYTIWFKEYCDISKITSLFHPWRDIELGYSVLNIILSRITDSIRPMMVIVSIIIITSNFMLIKKVSSLQVVSIALFFGFNFFITSMVSWRQFIAMGFVFWMYPFLMEKKYVKAGLMCIIALLFHDTALIFAILLIIIYLFSNHKKSSLIILLIGIIGFIFSGYILKLALFILPSYKYYFEEMIAEAGMGKMRLVYNIIEIGLIIYVYFNKKLYEKKYTVLSGILAVAVIMGFLAAKIPFMFRISYYFDYFIIFLIPDLLMSIKTSNKKMFYILEGLVLIASMVIYVYYLSTNPGNTVPYVLCL